MNITDVVFILLCLFLLIVVTAYIYKVEVYKKSIKEICLKDEKRICYCNQGVKDALEKNNT